MINLRPIYILLAHAIDAHAACVIREEKRMAQIWENRINYICKNYLPSGSGFNSGTSINVASDSECIILDTSYQHMTETGYYDGWTQHSIKLTPSFLSDFDIKVGGKNKNNIKEYIAEVFSVAMRVVSAWDEIDEKDDGGTYYEEELEKGEIELGRTEN